MYIKLEAVYVSCVNYFQARYFKFVLKGTDSRRTKKALLINKINSLKSNQSQ